MAQRKTDFLKSPDTSPTSPAPALREASSVTAEAIDREKHSSTSRGCKKILTAATETAPKVPTMIRSAEAKRIMNILSIAAGMAIFKYRLS